MTSAEQRGRGLHWLQALVLLVLLTGVVLPSPAREVGADPVVEAVLERVAVGTRRVAQDSAPRTTVVEASVRVDAPRPQPRTRSVHRRGLPPPRAPTA
ncbi:MAG: hypothetical protein JNK15_05655 [Planctomycetes bacterium]|nr:hypothetical protein [Planctomycetota bacterium]